MLAVFGLYFSVSLRFKPQCHLFEGLRYVLGGDKSGHGISPLKGLMTALASTVGTGNIAGIATAITMGGPGAIFYIWMMGFFALAVKYVETRIAVDYQIKGDEGLYGGPMYYIPHAVKGVLGKWITYLYVFSLCGAGLAIGAMVQSNSVAHAASGFFDLNPLWIGGGLAVLVGVIVIGGVQRIASAATMIVPVMVIVYIFSCLVVIGLNIKNIPDTFMLIVRSAFYGHEAIDGFAGATVWAAMHYGLSRGIFANEAGMGSAAIAHGAVQTKSSHQQAHVALLGTFIDTFLVCTMTGFVVLIVGKWSSGSTGALLTSQSLINEIGFIGNYIVVFSLVFFALSTILSWGYYTESAILSIGNRLMVNIYRFIWIAAIFFGAYYYSVLHDVSLIWEVADLFNGMMLFINLICLGMLYSKGMKNNS